jgi:beclin 1
LAKKVGIERFHKYQLVPYGSYSYLKGVTDEKTLPLYGSGGFRMIFDTKFDMAMVAFLDCLSQFAAEVQKQGVFSLPYEMDKGKIRDNNTGQWYSIKLQFNSEDLWTKALRYMLTNLKWGLAFVSMQYMEQQSDNSE